MLNSKTGLQFHLQQFALAAGSIGCVFAMLALYVAAADILGELLTHFFYQVLAKPGAFS